MKSFSSIEEFRSGARAFRLRPGRLTVPEFLISCRSARNVEMWTDCAHSSHCRMAKDHINGLAARNSENRVELSVWTAPAFRRHRALLGRNQVAPITENAGELAAASRLASHSRKRFDIFPVEPAVFGRAAMRQSP